MKLVLVLVDESSRSLEAWANGVKIGSTVRFQMTGYSTIYRQKAKFPEFIKIVLNCCIAMRKSKNILIISKAPIRG